MAMYEKTDYKHKSDKIKDGKHERRHRRDDAKKSKKRHHSRSRSNERKLDRVKYDDRNGSDRKHRRYDEKYYKKHDEYVDNCTHNKSDFNALSERKHKSKNDYSKSRHNRRRSSSASSNNEINGTSSPELDDQELLDHLRIRRMQLLAELSNQENQIQDPVSISPTDSVATIEEINIKFDSLANSEVIDTTDEKEKSPEPTNGTIDEANNEDCFDMFSDNFSVKVKPADFGGKIIETDNLNENWDDDDGYYIVRLGEVIDGRYTVFNFTGKGVFSNVVKARDSANNNQEVAIKLIRNNDMMYRAGLKEVDFLKKINDLDKNDKYHCVRLLRHFMHKNHLCLVFECLEMNLRDVLKKYGRNVGLNINAIRSYAQQMLLALKLIGKADIIHCDIKPDNILVNETKTVLKLSDFGSATNARDSDVTEYMVSRFYRAPEIILGLRYDANVDLWAIAVTLYELYTGQVMFPGKDNNDMLRLMMEAKGRLPNKMVKRGEYRDKHFDEQFTFLQCEVDRITEMDKVKLVHPGQPRTLSYDMFVRSKQAAGDADTDDGHHRVRQFRDFIDRILQLDPTKRMSINEALSHPFITESTKK